MDNFAILPRNVLIIYRLLIGKWFEPRSISYLSCVIVRVRVAFRKTIVGNYKHLNNLSGIYADNGIYMEASGHAFELLVTDQSKPWPEA